VTVSSGTAALHLALLALGVGAGSEVIVPSLSFAASANVVRLVGATPVFAEVDPATYCSTAELIEPLLTERTAAVMIVHLFGLAAAMDGIAELAARSGVALIEDAAQAHGADWAGRPVGSWGDVAAFSFYPTKNMTTGEGGMVTTPHGDLARQLRLLRNQGMERRYEHEIVGLNQRMPETAAAMGRVQLRKLPAWNAQRVANAEFYSQNLAGAVVTPTVPDRASHVFHQYTIRVANRDAVAAHLTSRGIGYGIYYPIPIHLQQPFVDAGASLPVTESLVNDVLSIPVRPDLEVEERELVTAAVIEAVQ
jgi:dTDP-4-amino-4,6-dideoxygalactose transaminase